MTMLPTTTSTVNSNSWSITQENESHLFKVTLSKYFIPKMTVATHKYEHDICNKVSAKYDKKQKL